MQYKFKLFYNALQGCHPKTPIERKDFLPEMNSCVFLCMGGQTGYMYVPDWELPPQHFLPQSGVSVGA
eukprot:3223709-Rhodomonas_salina.1